jgi:solute carrier family 25 folate transporter 32
MILQPLDLIDTRMQVQGGGGVGGREYASVRHAFRQIMNTNGFCGFYDGVGVSALAGGLSWAIYFGLYNYIGNGIMTRRHRHGHNTMQLTNNNVASLTTSEHMLCATSAGITTSLITNPLWVIRTRLQLQGHASSSSNNRYNGMIDACRCIIRHEGVGGLYRGLTPALLFVSNGTIQFTLYQQLKGHYMTMTSGGSGGTCDVTTIGSPQIFSMAATAKLIASCITFPITNITSRLHQRSSSSSTTPLSSLSSTSSSCEKSGGNGGRYRDMRHVITSVYGSEGYRGFYRGIVPHLMKTTPSSAITFLCYESVLRLIGHLPHPHHATR